MKNLLVFAIAMLFAFGCRKQAREILRPEVETKQSYKFFNEKEKQIAPKHEAGVVTFKLKNNSSLSRVAGKAKAEHVYTKAMERVHDRGYFKVKVEDETKTLNELKKNPDVEWASLNYAEVTQAINDPYWIDGSLWGLLHIGMPAVWNSGNFGNKQVFVGVIDEGIFSHDDLCKNIWKNPHELDNGIDDDGNGYIDDFHGWNWFDNNNQIYMGTDDHGTHVAGTIGAAGGNQIGVVGVNSNVTLISCKFLNGYGYDDGAIRAIDYLIDLKIRHGLNIKVTSNSWGGGGYNPAMIEAIERAKNADILFVAAAGNADNNNDVNPGASYPSAYPNENIISVGASDWQNNKASFSSYGKTTVDLFAPGVGIVSTVPSSQHTSSYAFYAGTSMATPHVSGACALYAGINPEANWQQIKAAILSSVSPQPQLVQYCATGGLLNVSSFLGQTPENQNPTYPCPEITPDQNPPTVPQFEVYEVGFDPTPGPFYGGYVAMRWTRAIDPEGGPVHYIVTKDGQDFYAVYGDNPVISIVFAGFQDTSQQVWKVRSTDQWGNQSNYSNSDTANWGSPPTPDIIPPTLNGNGGTSNITTSSITFSHPAASDNVGVASYTKNFRPIGGAWQQRTSSNLSETFSGLQSGTTYEFYYTARDQAGNVSLNSQIVSGKTLSVTPPPATCTPVSNNLTGSAIAPMTIRLTWTVSGGCTIQTFLERKKGENGSWGRVASNPTSPHNDILQQPGSYKYRLGIVVGGQTYYSNETGLIKVSKK